jgi:hypothetical protein
MLTLIGREVRDHIAYLLGLGIVTAIMIVVMILAAFQELEAQLLTPVVILVVTLLLGLYALGAAQMYGDRANRMSSLLSTLAVTRSRILAARVFVGMLAVAVSFVPLVVTITVLLWAFGSPLRFYERIIVETSITALLTGMACYCLGLVIGWTTNKTRLLAGSTLLVALVASLVWIKGLGPESMVILLLFIGATLLRIWRTFTLISL